MNTNEHEHVIEVTDLRRVYGGGFEAVRGITFSVARGEIFALLGTNGAGKTSTVELLEGLAAPVGGQVRVLGHDPYRERAAVRPRTGVMLQEGGFPSDLTIAETARMWAGCTSGARPVASEPKGRVGVEGATARRPEGLSTVAPSTPTGAPRRRTSHGAAEVLELVGLARKGDVRVKQLSGGERRRLDLALALLGDPEVLFLDEPTTGLDAEGRRDTWELVRGLRAAGTTVLLTTHYLEEAEGLADRLAILHEGRIAASGTPAEVTAGRPSRMSFELPDGYFLGDLPPLADLGVCGHENDGRLVRLRTRELQRTAAGVLAWAERAGVELRRLDVRSASLEEAFLGIAREQEVMA
ncbi:ABC transporter ATP-binding protein [Streptomyces sp. BK340]|uniref:ABC transporter ATP-binding protein n=1 Tax=Streptomyces sp. BK340 TaxID=2572903 RepID=UPI0011A51945|nr:ABC transporter ATP-binding protein [Streptomyces sp. BK340]TVZ80544.1 ABC-2 type transport system ATP-binding protein [Streptomyces sp. BK340]